MSEAESAHDHEASPDRAPVPARRASAVAQPAVDGDLARAISADRGSGLLGARVPAGRADHGPWIVHRERRAGTGRIQPDGPQSAPAAVGRTSKPSQAVTGSRG